MNEGLRVDWHDEVGVWTFDRPQARNAVDESVITGLESALEIAEARRDLRALVLTGSGESAFVAGADLKLMRDADPARRANNDTRMLRAMERLEKLPIPVIAALNGVAIGGGAEIALACDLRVAEPHASITFKHAAMGIAPGWGGLARLCSLVGRSAAAKLLFTAAPVSADEARGMGLVDEVVPSGTARERALALAQAVCGTSPSAVAEIKELLRLTYQQEGAARACDAERRTFLARASSADHAEALAAFFERRPPRFRPRGEG